MATAQERLTEWLRDAHAMERQAEQMLSGMAGRIANYPELKTQIERHLDETRQQARQIEQCLDRCGGRSVLKDVTGRLMGLGQAMSGLFTSDEVVKGVLASYSFEHMEIASYRILIATAQMAGDDETARVCEDILRQEEAMAAWLGENLAPLTRAYIERDETPGTKAKH